MNESNIGDLRSKECGQDVAHKTTDGMNGEDIKSIIDSKNELQLGGIVAGRSTDNSKDNSRPGRNVTRTRRNCDKTRDHAGAEPNRRPFLLQSVIKHTPSNTTDGSSKVGHNGSHDSAHVGAQSRSSIEAEPANPEENGADDDMGDVVRTIIQFVCSMAPSLAEHERICQGGRTGRDVDRSSSCKIKTTHLEGPAGRIPCPASNGIVDDGRPDEHEDNTWEHTSSFGNGTDG